MVVKLLLEITDLAVEVSGKQVLKDIDLYIDQGETHHAMPSTILDMSRTPPQILREGPITAEMLSEVVNL